MDNTLVQIINEWIATQSLLRQAQQENAGLKAQIAELQGAKPDEVKPGSPSAGVIAEADRKAEAAERSESKPPVDAPLVSDDGA